MIIARLVLLSLLAMSLNASAVLIETAEGNSYDVQSGGTPSPYLAWLEARDKKERDMARMDFVEIRYQSRLPLNQANADKLRAEAKEVFEKYLKATGNAYYEQAQKLGQEEKRLLNMLIWVGSGKEQVTIRGQKLGEVLEQRITPHYYYAVINPAGQGFSFMGFPESAFWVRGESASKVLPFLNDDHKTADGYPATYLKDVLGVQGSPLWVAFVVKKIRRESVDLQMDVFDSDRIVRSEVIENSIRNMCDEPTFKGYSIEPGKGNQQIAFNTLSGVIVYDVKRGIFSSGKMEFAPVRPECR